MPFTFTMPKLSPTMETGIIAKWHKKVGDRVEAGDVLLEISTDKATVEHTALDEGWLRRILVNDGGEAAVNQPIAIFTEQKDESVEGYEPKETGSQKTAQAAAPTVPPKVLATPAPSTEDRLKASPLARKLAGEQGVDLKQLSGTGPGGRIMSRDLGSVAGGAEESLTPMRKVIAQRLQQAKATIPHFYVRQSVIADGLVALKEELAQNNIKVTYNDMVVRACALALRDFPAVNSGFNDQKKTLIRFPTIDICVAVSIEGGLITPIVSSTDKKSLTEISQEVKELSKRAKENKLRNNEFQGGSFTVSNLGMYGIDDFAAIINPPQAAILAVGAILDQPIARDGQIVAAKILHLTLSADHRVIDGALAAQFLQRLKQLLESPALLMA